MPTLPTGRSQFAPSRREAVCDGSPIITSSSSRYRSGTGSGDIRATERGDRPGHHHDGRRSCAIRVTADRGTANVGRGHDAIAGGRTTPPSRGSSHTPLCRTRTPHREISRTGCGACSAVPRHALRFGISAADSTRAMGLMTDRLDGYAEPFLFHLARLRKETRWLESEPSNRNFGPQIKS